MSDGLDGADLIAVICGPTGAGKSTLAIALAERLGRAIIVADSRQVYRRFDIGTAKPSAAERRRVRHHGFDLADPTERYSAAQWVSEAEGHLAAGLASAAIPIIVGGTGMYLRALFDGLFAEPVVDDDRRRALLDWLDGQTTERLRAWVVELDPPRAALGRTQLLRAVEVAMLTGQRISRLHETHATPPRWRARYLVIDPGETLPARIARRFDAMIDDGWLDEVRALRGVVPDNAPAWKSTGYRALRDVVDGTMSLTDARERILIETRQYAKRQRTWFRHQLPDERTTRLNPESPDAAALVDAWWHAAESP